MRERRDPLIPILGSAVALVVVAFVGLVLYPRVSRWFGPEKSSVAASRPEPTDKVPVWICRSVKGVALMVENGYAEEAERVLDRALSGGRHHYLRLWVYNFGCEEPFTLALGDGLHSPEGGPPALPAAARLKPDLPGHLRMVLRGMGAVLSLEVAKGRSGQALLALQDDPCDRSSFAAGELMFERRELERTALAKWREKPDLNQFLDF